MQRVKPKMSRRKAFLVLFLILAGVGLLVWGGISLFSVRVVTNVTASLLPTAIPSCLSDRTCCITTA